VILNEQIRLEGKIQSVILSPSGSLAAVVVDHNKLLIFDVSGGTFVLRNTHPLPANRFDAPWASGVTFRESRVAFLDERTLILAWSVDRDTKDRSIPSEDRRRIALLSVDVDQGDVRGEYETEGDAMAGPPLPLDPRHVLFGLHRKTLVCLDVTTWREVSRVRELDEALDPIGDESECPEEGLTTNGVAFIPVTGRLHVLWGYAFGSALQTYQVAEDRSRFVSLSRSTPFDKEPAALCAKPDGSEIAALLSDYGTKLPLPKQAHVLPRRTRLGALVLTSPNGSRFVDVESDTERDFACWKELAQRSDGLVQVTGYSIFVEPVNYEPCLFYLDERTVAISSPKGYLLVVDTLSGRSELVHDFLSTVKSMVLHAEKRLLLAGCDDQSLSLLTA
jgi:hypothetical protein